MRSARSANQPHTLVKSYLKRDDVGNDGKGPRTEGWGERAYKPMQGNVASGNHGNENQGHTPCNPPSPTSSFPPSTTREPPSACSPPAPREYPQCECCEALQRDRQSPD